MTGFINRLFRRGSQPADTNGAQPAQPKQEGSYFLDPDEARTYGDIDYMRTARKVRKTFMGGAVEVIDEVSATEKRRLEEKGQQEQPPAEASNTPAPDPSAPTSQFERRRASAEMDMFRNMARDLGKKS